MSSGIRTRGDDERCIVAPPASRATALILEKKSTVFTRDAIDHSCFVFESRVPDGRRLVKPVFHRKA